MANTCTIATGSVSGTLSSNYSAESVQELFYVHLDSPTRNIVAVANAARAANPTQFPLKGQSWPANSSYGLFAKTFAFSMRNNLGTEWQCDVTYSPLEPGEPNIEGVSENPLMWPAVFGLEWMEEEQAVEQGRNVEAIGSASLPGERAALTLGAIVNSALVEFEEGLFRTKRIPVITVTRNVATLDEIYALQTNYEDTTNSDTISSIGARRFEYLLVDHQGQQTANGILYYSRTAKVALRKTTDRKRNNIGWHGWKTIEGTKQLLRLNVYDEETEAPAPASEPSFLTLAGAQSFSPTQVTYRVLNEVPYASLLS